MRFRGTKQPPAPLVGSGSERQIGRDSRETAYFLRGGESDTDHALTGRAAIVDTAVTMPSWEGNRLPDPPSVGRDSLRSANLPLASGRAQLQLR